nr:unnamed protein product [Spirometra erinaceieuropaei]
MSSALVAAYKSAINPDGLVPSITKTAYRRPEKSSVQLKIYMMRWLKTNVQKLRKKYKKYNGDRKVDTKTLSPSLRREDTSSSESAAKLHYATPQAVPSFIPHILYANDQNAGCQSARYSHSSASCHKRGEQGSPRGHQSPPHLHECILRNADGGVKRVA